LLASQVERGLRAEGEGFHRKGLWLTAHGSWHMAHGSWQGLRPGASTFLAFFIRP
jgi:hypothetical protein